MQARHPAAGGMEQTNWSDDHPPFIPSIPTDDIFRELIGAELRCGRLTAARHEEIAKYALQFGLSLAQTENLIAQAKRDIAHDDEALAPTTHREARDRHRHPPVKPLAYIIAGVFLILLDVTIVALT